MARCALARAVDIAAKEYATKHYGVPECLHVPVAAVNRWAIQTYVGNIARELCPRSPGKALLVEVDDPPLRDGRLPIWEHPNSPIFHQRQQVWVQASYNRYRQAYIAAFPDEDVSAKILSHAMNRRVAAIKGFQYVRITPTSRGANSSSGFSEGWAVALWSKPAELASFKRRRASIQYADLSDLMLMLDLKLGGGIMDAVNAGQKLILPPA